MNDSPTSTPGGVGPGRFCPSCGSSLSPGARFCGECGAPTGGDTDEASPGQTVSTTPAPGVPVQTAAKSAPAFPTGIVVLVLAGILIVVLSGAGFLTYRLFFPNGHRVPIPEAGDKPVGGGEGPGGKFPVTFGPETLRHYSTPAQLVYFHFVSEVHRANEGRVTVGSPRITESQIDIRLKFEGDWENWRVVETENNGQRAVVAVGLADAGAYELYVLERLNGAWAIVGAQETDGS